MELVIYNNQNKRFIIFFDECDFDIISSHKWHVRCGKHTCYAATNICAKSGKKTILQMHRLLLGLKCADVMVDHVNGNGLDNRRINIRTANASQNSANSRVSINSKSGFKGVCFDKKNKCWVASITKNRKRYTIGRFNCKLNAAIAYDIKAEEMFGEFAKLNIPNIK